MTLPTTSYVRSYDVGVAKRVIINGTRQRKPYNLPLPYFKQVYMPVLTGTFQATPPTDYPTRVTAINASYARFIAAIGEKAENATNVIQYKQALSTIEKRGMQLFQFTRALRRGRLAEAASIIGYTPTARGRSKFKRRSREFGGLWLEYAYGIAPLVKDIYTSIDILQRPLPPFRVSGSAVANLNRQYWNGPFEMTEVFMTRCKHRSHLHVSNPNLWLANQMGLVNPGSWVWEAIPFSFVCDWFANVGQVIASLTDLAGLTTVNPFVTIVSRSNEKNVYGGFLPLKHDVGHFVERSLGVITPSLEVRPFKGFSVARAANAISLLLVQLR